MDGLLIVHYERLRAHYIPATGQILIDLQRIERATSLRSTIITSSLRVSEVVQGWSRAPPMAKKAGECVDIGPVLD